MKPEALIPDRPDIKSLAALLLRASNGRERGTPSKLPRAVVDVIPSSPAGPLLVALSAKGLAMLHFLRRPDDAASAIAKLGRRFEPAAEQGGADQVRDELARFMAGDESALRSKVDLSLVYGSFQQRVLRLLTDIGPGAVISYSALAAWAGEPEAARAVGGAMHDNPIPLYVPCHRVVRSELGLGGYGGGLDLKRRLLEVEGFSFTGSGQVADSKAVWGNRNTKVFCRPECRHMGTAHRINLILFRDAARAERSGMRPCATCAAGD